MQNILADKKIERAEFFAKLDNELKARIREVNNADDYDVKDGYTEKDRLQLQLLDDDISGDYLKLLDMDSAIRKLEAEIEYQKKTDNSKVQYFDTAGEIEARETADRLKMTAEERAQKMPDLGWERAVFAEKINKNDSIERTIDNRPVVVIKNDILSGINVDDWIITVKNVISKKFPNGIPIKGKLIKVNKVTRNEYTHSKNSDYYKRKEPVIYEDKFKAANNLDEIILASTNYVNEDLKHQRKDNIIDFARGDVLMRVGNNDYSAKVVIGFTSKNEMLLYDVIDFIPTNFKIKNEDELTEHLQEAKFSRHHSSSDTRISQNDSSVNDNFMQSPSEDSLNTDLDEIYSKKQTDEITRFNMQTAKENRIYRQIFNLLDDAVYTGIRIKKIPDPKFIRQQAQEMLKEVGSTYSVNELTEELTVVYEYMSQQAGKNLYKTEDFFPNVLAIARRVVDQCTEKDSSAYDDAKEIRDVIKETPIYISPELKNEIISQFGSY